MLVELRVHDLGVIDDLTVELGPGMTALTGETGAGKTLLVEAVELLLGGRADPTLVRHGADRAVVEGRFDDGESEHVLIREVRAEGRSRGYLDGQMATAGALAEAGARLVDLYGQHAHQSLVHQAAQREALDRFARVDTTEVDRLAGALRALEARRSELGGDAQALAREVDLLGYQLAELDRAALSDPGEEERLVAEEEVLAAAEALQEAASAARDALGGDEGARDQLARARLALGHHGPLADLSGRIGALEVEVDDLAAELRNRLERFEQDPARLAEVQARRRLLAELRRKYGTTLGAVIDFRESARARLADLAAGDGLRAALAAEAEQLTEELRRAEQALGDARRRAAPELGRQIEHRLRSLALAKARFEVVVGAAGRGDDVEFRFGANPGEPALPLARVASGGELARAMLATRLVLTESPPTMIFDEVDAGIGGEAALSVGRALAELGEHRQVLVVTHLAQVAAFAREQVAVEKTEVGGRTVTTARPVEGEDRLAELSRMLSGQPGSEAARRHARELLELTAGRP